MNVVKNHFQSEYESVAIMADMINTRVIGQSFTFGSLKDILQWDKKEIENAIERLGQFYFLEMIENTGIPKYKIMMDAEKRKKYLLDHVELVARQYLDDTGIRRAILMIIDKQTE